MLAPTATAPVPEEATEPTAVPVFAALAFDPTAVAAPAAVLPPGESGVDAFGPQAMLKGYPPSFAPPLAGLAFEPPLVPLTSHVSAFAAVPQPMAKAEAARTNVHFVVNCLSMTRSSFGS
ncbi:MAG TPA: hypothetical protein VF409_10465 [Sphingomonas sp.]